MKKALVSILIPAYNAEAWISDTLRSAIAQTWEPKEIIAVDDGSTDNTLAIARQFESAGIRIVTQTHQGAAAARNKAFSLSCGDYIQYLDADDLMTPDKIARQMDMLGRSPGKLTLLSGSWGNFRYRFYKAEFIPSALWCDLSPIEWLMRKMQFNLYMQTATWLVSRELSEAAGPWDTRLLGDDDGEYFCRVLLASDQVRFVPEAKVFYRDSGPRRLSYIGGSDEKLAAHWCSMKLHIRHILSLEDSPRVREACVLYLKNWVSSFYPYSLDLVKQFGAMAESLGGRLELPPLSWKVAWLSPLFGRPAAKRVQDVLAYTESSLKRHWDKVLFQIENQRVFGHGKIDRNHAAARISPDIAA